MEHPAVVGGGRDRRARPGGRRGGQGVRHARRRATSRATTCGSTSSGSPAGASAPRWRPGRSRSTSTSPRPRAARSCAACSRHASSGCPRATCPPSRCAVTPVDHRSARRPRPGAAPAARAGAHPAVRGALRRAVQRDRRSAGFLHLYIGEEAVAVGVMEALDPDDAVVATYRDHGHALARGVAAAAVMAEMFGKVEGTSRGRGGSMHLFDRADPVLRRQRHRRRRAAPRRRAGAGRHLQHRDRRDRLLLRRGRRGRGRVPRDHEPGRAVATCRCSSAARTTSTPWAPPSSAARRSPTSRMRAAGYGMPAWPVDGMDVLAVADAARAGRARGPRRRRPGVPRAAHLPVPGPLDVRPRALPLQGRGRRLATSATRSACSPSACDAGGLLADDDLAAIERRRRRRDRRAPWPPPRPGTLEPVEDLTRFVTSEATAVP